MTTLYVAIALGMLAAVGVFATVISLSPAAPSNADVVEGRLRVYETGAPPSIAEIDLQQPFGERVVRPALTRLGRFLEQSMPEKAREQIYMTLQLAGRPGGMTPSYFIAVRYVLTAALCCLGILIGTLAHNQILLAILATVCAVICLSGTMFLLRQSVRGRRAEFISDVSVLMVVLSALAVSD